MPLRCLLHAVLTVLLEAQKHVAVMVAVAVAVAVAVTVAVAEAVAVVVVVAVEQAVASFALSRVAPMRLVSLRQHCVLVPPRLSLAWVVP